MSLVFKYAARISMPGVRVTQEVLRARWIFPEIRKKDMWKRVEPQEFRIEIVFFSVPGIDRESGYRYPRKIVDYARKKPVN